MPSTGESIHRVRTAKKLSQTALVNMLRDLGPSYATWDQTYISKIERGVRAVTSDELRDFARVLNVSPLELLNSSV